MGSRVEAYYEMEDGARSEERDEGTVVAVQGERINVLFDDGVEQRLPRDWVRPCQPLPSCRRLPPLCSTPPRNTG